MVKMVNHSVLFKLPSMGELPIKMITTTAIKVVIQSLSPVNEKKERCFKACFPSTVELPQAKAAQSAMSPAINVLSSIAIAGKPFSKVTR